MKMRVFVTFTASLALLTGCSHTPQGYVAKEWSASMRELGIVPVFPPREDVQVGDIYLAPVSPDEEYRAFKRKEFLPLGLWLATLNLSNELAGFYASRSRFPITPEATTNFMEQLENSPFAALTQACDTNRNVFVGGDTSRLRMVGFPQFMSATLKKGDLAAVIPVEAVNLAFAAGFRSGRSVTLSVPVAESYGLPADKIWPKIMNAEDGLMPFVEGIPRTQLHNLVNAKQVVGVGTNFYAPLRIITEVYYARALDVSVASHTAKGFGVAGRPLAADAAATAASAIASPEETTGTEPAPTAEATNLNSSAVERAAELNQSLDRALTQTVPGGSVKFVTAGDRAVCLRRTYERPIAIGYRAMQLLVPIKAPGGEGMAGAVSGFVPTAHSGAVLSGKTEGKSKTETRPSDAPTLKPGKKVKPDSTE